LFHELLFAVLPAADGHRQLGMRAQFHQADLADLGEGAVAASAAAAPKVGRVQEMAATITKMRHRIAYLEGQLAMKRKEQITVQRGKDGNIASCIREEASEYLLSRLEAKEFSPNDPAETAALFKLHHQLRLASVCR
jgi:hypothetical protein